MVGGEKFNPPCEVETFTMSKEGESSLYPIAVLIDELRNDDVQVGERGKRVMSVNLKPEGTAFS